MKKGKLIASGVGMPAMLDLCYKAKLTKENTILEVTDVERGKWEIYEKLD